MEEEGFTDLEGVHPEDIITVTDLIFVKNLKDNFVEGYWEWVMGRNRFEGKGGGMSWGIDIVEVEGRDTESEVMFEPLCHVGEVDGHKARDNCKSGWSRHFRREESL